MSRNRGGGTDLAVFVATLNALCGVPDELAIHTVRRMTGAALLLACLWGVAAQGPGLCQSAVHASRPASNLKLDSYIQVRYTDDDIAGNYISVRRAKAMFTWDPAPGWRVYVQALFKDGNRAINDGRLWVQELWARRRAGGGWLTLGQFKPPFGMERFTADSSLDTIDRSQPTDRLIPNGGLAKSFGRDVGIQWECDCKNSGWMMAAGIFKGDGALSEPYGGNGPLLAGRATHRWKLAKRDWVHLGLAVSARRDRDIDFSGALPGTKSLGTNHLHGSDTRWGLEAAADTGRWRFRSEYLAAHLSGASGQHEITATGWYAQATYVLNRHWEVVAKHEALDPNTGIVDRYDIGWTTLGTNWLIHGHREKVQVDYVIKRDRPGAASDNTLLIQFQRYL
ncbi:MAG: porin [Chthonomonadales bacterium]